MRTIAVTLGDPAGVGPEVVARALAESDLPDTRFVVIGGEKTLLAGAQKMGANLSVRSVGSFGSLDGSRVQVLPPGPWPDAAFGKPGSHTGKAAFDAIDLAATLALDRKVDAVVTAPV